MVLLENVRRFTVDFDVNDSEQTKNFAGLLKKQLGEQYHVFSEMIKASDFGVPEERLRFILMAVRKDSVQSITDAFGLLKQNRGTFLRKRGLLGGTGSRSALSDLETGPEGKVPSTECPGFLEIKPNRARTSFQRYSRDGHRGPISDTRLAKHNPEIREQFSQIMTICAAEGRLNTSLGKDLRASFGLKKQAFRVLDPDRPAPTITMCQTICSTIKSPGHSPCAKTYGFKFSLIGSDSRVNTRQGASVEN